MAGFINGMMQRFRYRVSHGSKFPKGDLTSFFLNLEARGFGPKQILDIGANRGRWSRDAARIFPDCVFTLVEPQLEMAPYLDAFCEGKPGSQWILAGAGAQNGKLPFTVEPTTYGSSFAIDEATARKRGHQRRMIDVYTVDHIVSNIMGATPDIVKLDAEGFEFEILKGAGSVLGKTELFLLEANFMPQHGHESGFVATVNAMAEHGYSPYDFTWFGKRPYDGALGLCEIAFARNDGQLRSYKRWDKAAA